MRALRFGKISISSALMLLFAWLWYQDTSGLFEQGILACGMHETAHYVALRSIGNDIKEFRLTVFGAKIIPTSPMTYWQELIVAAAGPAVNLVLAFCLCRSGCTMSFVGVNLALAWFNLLPVGQLDGGRIFRCTLAMLVSDAVSLKIGWCVSFAFTSFFLVVGMYIAARFGNISLFLMCSWLLSGGAQEKTFQF